MFKFNHGTRVEIVPDDDADADPRIPKDVLADLGQNNILANFGVMYVRHSTWERMKHRFPVKTEKSDIEAAE